MSHRRIPALAVAALLGLSVAITGSAQTAQQMRMKQCNVDASAKHLKGHSRQSFMRMCLSGPRGGHLALNSQQRRMKDCNAQAKAKGLRGGDQKRYVISCLKGH